MKNNQWIDCVKMQRTIRNNIIKENQNRPLTDIVSSIKKNPGRNKIWLSLTKKENTTHPKS